MHDEDNDGRFPDESPVEVRYPRSTQEEHGDCERWPGGGPANGDRVIRLATAAVVCAVATFAAVVSLTPISTVWGRGMARTVQLLPLSVDGLILAVSLVLLHEARNNRDAPALARLMYGSTSAPRSAQTLPTCGIRAARR